MVITIKATENSHYREKIDKLLSKLKLKHNDISLYVLAFIHRSIVNERPDFAPLHNERLEFLWDAVLELAITNALYKDFPNKTEWELTDIRSALVRWKNLAVVAKKLDFSEYLLLWKWEEKTWWRDNDYILANTVESLIWAIYIDSWINIATNFIIEYIYTTLPNILENNLTKDYKTLFQEFAQADFEITPDYKLIDHSWPDHDKKFEIWAYIWKELYGIWVWSSKKKAQEDAAQTAYLKLTNKK